MKKNFKYLVVFCLCSISFTLKAQETTKEAEKITNIDVASADTKVEEEPSPSIFKFEPDYMTSVHSERKQLKRNKEILDTLSVSERRKKKLLKKMFKSDFREHLSKKGLVDTEFEYVD